MLTCLFDSVTFSGESRMENSMLMFFVDLILEEYCAGLGFAVGFLYDILFKIENLLL